MTVAPVGRRWPWYLLIASLAANMLLVGVVAGSLLRWGPPPPPPDPERGMAAFIERVAGDLAPADAEILRSTFEAKRPLLRRQEANREALREAVDRALLDEPFDPETLRAAFASFHAVENAMNEEVDATVVDVLGRLSPEARRVLAESRPRRP